MNQMLKKGAEMVGGFLKSCTEKNGIFLFATAALGWIMASCAQTIGIAKNKDLSKDQKRFLVPQEILDGVFNIASYVAITVPTMILAKKGATKLFPSNKTAVEGASVIAAIAGGVASSNIATPILRNKIGAHVKKKMEEKNIQPVNPQIYNGRTFPGYRSSQPLSAMKSYVNFAKNRMQPKGSLKI